MSRSAGTGTPNWFMCHVERREWRAEVGEPLSYEYLARHRPEHRIRLTGRERPNPSNRRNARVDAVEREYECSCGHVGWTRLRDVLRRAARDTQGGTR